MFMCENCSNWHSKWPANKKHTVLAINELSSPEAQAKIKSKLYCKKHQDKTLKFYCETCKVRNIINESDIYQLYLQTRGIRQKILRDEILYILGV